MFLKDFTSFFFFLVTVNDRPRNPLDFAYYCYCSIPNKELFDTVETEIIRTGRI